MSYYSHFFDPINHYLRAFFKEQTLTAQALVKDGSKTVEQYLKESGDVKIREFKRVALG